MVGRSVITKGKAPAGPTIASSVTIHTEREKQLKKQLRKEEKKCECTACITAPTRARAVSADKSQLLDALGFNEGNVKL